MQVEAPAAARSSEIRPKAIGESAAENLRYIRNTIEATHTFSLVPGRGSVAIGLIAIAAAALELQEALAPSWLTIWLGAAVVSAAVGLFEIAEKARIRGISLRRTVAWRFFTTLVPAFSVGGVLTAALLDDVGRDVIGAIWLLCYGAGVTACGAFAASTVLIAGCTFLGLGIVTLTAPVQWTPGLLALGFGGTHIALGLLVMRADNERQS